ncbi:MAG: hypothetical protein WDN09_00435 [bacterium]
MANKNIGADPDKVFGLQGSILERLRAAVKKNDGRFILHLEKFLKMSASKRDEIFGITGVSEISGRLKRAVSGISLEATESFNTKDFFKTKDQGGIFVHVDGDIFSWLETEVKNSPAKELASYKFTEDITEENIIGDAKAGGIYEEVDMAHVKQICERHIVGGEKLLLDNGYANLFWVRNKKGALCGVCVYWNDDGWDVFVVEFRASFEWRAGDRSFFRNHTQ